MFKEEELRLAQEVAGLAIWEWVEDTDELHWQPGSVPLLGRPLNEINTGEEFFQCLIPEDRDRVRQCARDALKSGSDYRVEFRVRSPEGQTRWIVRNGRVMRDPERGRILVGVERDITETKLRENKLRAQARLLDLAYEPILVRDAQDHILYWNGGAERLYGYGWQEARSQRSHDLLKTQFPKPLEEIEKQLREHGQWEGELIHRTKSGRYIHIASRWQKISPEDNTILETNFDLSQQRALEVARAWQEKAKLITELAHEINNPLEAARGATHILRASCDQDARQYVQVLEDSIKRIAGFIKRSNEIHKQGRLESEQTDKPGPFGPM